MHDRDILNYAKYRSGSLSSTFVETVALLKTKYATDDIPDVYLLLSPSKSFFTRAGLLSLGMESEFYDSVYGILNGSDIINISPSVARSQSLGHTELRSANPLDAPLIDPNYFSNPADLDVLVEAVKMVLNLTNTNAFKNTGIKYPNYNFPSCQGIANNTDSYWKCVLRQIPSPFLHATSTCKMGIDNEAVVNPRLLVNGVFRLRVIDASIMPAAPNAPIHGSTVMIGEKGSDLVKEDWGQYFK